MGHFFSSSACRSLSLRMVDFSTSNQLSEVQMTLRLPYLTAYGCVCLSTFPHVCEDSTGFLLNFSMDVSARLAGQQACWILPTPSPAPGLKIHVTKPGFHVCSGDLNSGLNACTAFSSIFKARLTLSTEPAWSPWQASSPSSERESSICFSSPHSFCR